jgi:alkanesulfonate monooxygenase SsuD/methylene tetrahydromethanopterin reductase-like flavin-dependent oxidoreductase (luciferase family)
MIEGQEGVTWEEWLALAEACEEHGLEGLFRSDHYASVFDEYARGSLDAWATISALAAGSGKREAGSGRSLLGEPFQLRTVNLRPF